jgi:hypothetical protein
MRTISTTDPITGVTTDTAIEATTAAEGPLPAELRDDFDRVPRRVDAVLRLVELTA